MNGEDTFFKRSQDMTIKGQIFNMSKPLVMGIINITPDSFHAASRATNALEACELAEKQLSQGASFLDLGAISTRPGAPVVSPEEEKKRLLPVLALLVKTFPEAIISVDTFNAEIAKASIEAGAAIINDVTGGEGDQQMLSTVAKLNCPYIAMHSRGNSLTMTELTQYNKLPDDIIKWFAEKIKKYTEAGIHDIIVDPGIGFAKNAEQNFTIIDHLNDFKILEKPILMGISRKRFIYNTLNIPVENSLNGTTAMHMACLMNGANILRVHDVKEAIETVQLFLQMKKSR